MAERKSTAVLIKLSPAEKRALSAAARRENLPMATWLRALGLQAARAANKKGHTMKTILAIAILGLAAACGGTEQAAAPSRFAGTWNGQAEFNASAPFTAPTTAATVTLTDMDAGTVRLAGFCPDGSGAIDLEFDADPAHAAVAHNVAVCAPAPVGACDKTELIFSFVDAAIQPDGSLRGLAAGWAIGCGASSTTSLLLSAHKTAQ